jgi:hypothetical protein
MSDQAKAASASPQTGVAIAGPDRQELSAPVDPPRLRAIVAATKSRRTLPNPVAYALAAAVIGIARNVLTNRLNRLVQEGVLERVPYSEHPQRHEYRLTQKGRDLNLALTGLRQWGDKHLSEKPPRLLRRKTDKKPVIAALVPKGTHVLRPGEVELVPGPGLKSS